jgi:SPP1 gp7 family putative phage head morphogenesis protein
VTLWLPGEAGIRAIDDVLWILGVPTSLSKAEGTPLTRRGFEAIVRALTAQMVEATTPVTRRVRTRYQQLLDRRWREMTAEDRERAVLELAGRMRSDLVSTVQTISAAVERSTRGTINATVQATALKHRLDVPTVFSARDAVYADHARRANAVYMRDRFGRIVAGPVAQGVRDVIARGVDDGRDNQTIAEDIARVAQGTIAQRTQDYYVLVASTATARARTYGELTSFQRAGIKRYTVQSVRDESTCDTCNFMHGRSFDVADAVERFDRAARSDPEALPDIHPFVSARKIGDGVYIGARTRNTFEPIAQVERSARGTKDQQGSFRTILDDARIQSLGAGCCPFHPHCRCVLIPSFVAASQPRSAPRVVAPPAQPAAPPPAPVPVAAPAAPPRPPTTVSFVPPPAPPAPPPPPPIPIAPAPIGPFEIRVENGRPRIGPPLELLTPAEAVKEWVATYPRAAVDEATLRTLFKDKVPKLEDLRRAWSDPEAGAVTTFSSVRATGGTAHFEFTIRDALGRLVTEGSGERSIKRASDGKLEVYHAYLRVFKEAGGAGSAITRNSLRAYSHIGVDRVTVSPAWAGKYVWGTFGFDWTPAMGQKHLDRFPDFLRLHFGMSVSEAEDFTRKNRTAFRHPWRVGDLDIPGKTIEVPVKQSSRDTGESEQLVKCHAGKAFMLLKGEWSGTLEIGKASSASWKRASERLLSKK